MPIINKTNIQHIVPIILADGQKDSVNLQPGGRLNLPAGAILDPTKARQFADALLDTDAASNAQAVANAAAVGIAKDRPSTGQTRATVQIGSEAPSLSGPSAPAPAPAPDSGSNNKGNGSK